MLAVCYRCFFQGEANDELRCPECDFALIIESREPTSIKHIEDIFSRYSVRMGAPGLPGVKPKTHSGLAPKFLAMGTGVNAPTPSAEVLTMSRQHQVAAGSSVSAMPMPPPIPIQARQTMDEDWMPVRYPRPDTAVVYKRGISVREIFCVALAALVSGAGAAFLMTLL